MSNKIHFGNGFPYNGFVGWLWLICLGCSFLIRRLCFLVTGKYIDQKIDHQSLSMIYGIVNQRVDGPVKLFLGLVPV